MGDLQKKRFAAGLMADAEIISAIEDEVYKPLESKTAAPEFTRYKTIRGADIVAFVGGELDKEIYSQEVSYGERPLMSASNDEFLQMEKIKKLMPAAEVLALQHYGFCDDYSGSDDPELIVNVYRVTMSCGALEFSRDYLLSGDSNEN